MTDLSNIDSAYEDQWVKTAYIYPKDDVVDRIHDNET